MGYKWIESRPGDTVEQVARRALKGRLERMWHFMVLAAEGPLSETENVHQLRVFSRRVAAAMEIFADYLPRRSGHWMQSKVKRVRKSSGDARDFDVIALRWRERLEGVSDHEAPVVLDEIQRRRHVAQQPIEASHHKLRKKNFSRRIAKLAKHVRRRGDDDACSQEIGCMATRSLAALVTPFLAAGEAAMTDAQALHGFRIQGKRVRYAMEIFAGAFDEDFRQQLYPLVAGLQDRLGAINDHVTAGNYFSLWRDQAASCSLQQALDSAVTYERQLFEATKSEFLAWWTSERRADLRKRFDRYVQINPQPPFDAGQTPRV
jgi:CHAD domain-containing protein